jgi:tetratricopeptide (TPR) repeat protein
MLTDELGGLEQAREIAARERLEEVQALARTYRHWSVKELAHALGRQPGRLVPDSGMPKIDLVVGLAKALDWPVEAVVDHLMKPASSSRGAVVQQDTAADYATLYNKSLEMRLARDYAEAIRLAVRAGAVADNPTRRAAALIIEAQAHESMGSFTESVRCLGMATRFDGVEADWRLYVDAHLANMLFMQGHVTQALGVATSVLEYGEKLQPTVRTSTARMLAHWSRANVLRSAIPSSGEIDAWRPLAESARSDLHAARDLGNELMQDVSDKPIYFRNFVGSIEPLLLELDTICDSASTEQAMRTLIEMVRSTSDGELGHGQRKAWAAVAIASIARRFVSDEPCARTRSPPRTGTSRIDTSRSMRSVAAPSPETAWRPAHSMPSRRSWSPVCWGRFRGRVAMPRSTWRSTPGEKGGVHEANLHALLCVPSCEPRVRTCARRLARRATAVGRGWPDPDSEALDPALRHRRASRLCAMAAER